MKVLFIWFIVNVIGCDGWEYCVQRGIRLTQNLQIPKLEFKIKTNGLIQKYSSNHTTKRMVTKIYHAKLIYNGLIQNGAYVH
jgi:hypothetical protein